MAAQVSIFFGSQSGTAECFSEELRDEASEQGISCEVIDLQTFTPETFAAVRVAVLVVSTYGEGEPTDNAVQFHKWASDPRNDGALKGQRFCVMGLGDMNYARFNNMGLETDQNLERLGGIRIYQRGVGDDSQDIAADFARWKSSGLWQSLKKAIAEVQQQGPAVGRTGLEAKVPSSAPAVTPTLRKPEVHVFFGHEEADGAAKDVCEVLTRHAREAGLEVPVVQSLSDRKAVEIVRKLPRRAVAIVIADAGPEGLCAAARKLVRNMNLELDSNSLSEKDLSFVQVTVASSKSCSSASAVREAVQQGAEPVAKAFSRAGVKQLGSMCYLDAGVESVEPLVAELCKGLAQALAATAAASAPAPAAATPVTPAAEQAAVPRVPATSKTRISYTGPEAKEAAEALAAVWPAGAVSEEASLGVLAAAAQERTPLVLAVECASDSGLSDASRGFAAMLAAAPIAVQAQLRQLHFVLLAVAATDYGNAGERASANAARAELSLAAAPVQQALTKFGARCAASTCIDLQDADDSKLTELCGKLREGFADGAPAARAPAAASALGTPVLRMAARSADLPAEAPGEPADVLARWFFEADRAKVLRVRELRQCPNVEQGLATAEVEFEATGGLKGYSLGGTLSLLPENDPADVAAMLPFLGLVEADLDKAITFVAAEGSGLKVKKPFPTPCLLRDALFRHCDLGRAPTKKMLAALQEKLKDATVREHVGRLLADGEALKSLQATSLCLRMPELWRMLGVSPGGISASDFLLHCPRQKAREFTIASSPKATPDSITLCVSLTSQQLTDPNAAVKQLQITGCLPAGAALPASRDRFFGMCSRWLTSGLKKGDTILAKQRPSALHLPEKDVPIIMVGAGAGVAPFRGFWEELRRSTRSAPAALFFGCRHPDSDWLFREEMNSAVKLAAAGCSALAKVQVGPKRPLTCLFTAFSRPGEGKKGRYVQDQVHSQAQSLKHWIEQMAGTVYICGSTAMGTGVLEALAGILEEGGKERVEALRKEGRIVAEMWG